MRWLLRTLFVMTALSFGSGSARTEDAHSPASLSDKERAAVGAILDGLTTSAGENLKQIIFNSIDGLGDPTSAETVVRAVEIGAGGKLQTFESALVSKCLGGGTGYCKLAALRPPSDNTSINTAATSGDGGGAGSTAGDGAGGGPQVNFNRGSAAVTTATGPRRFADSTAANQALGQFAGSSTTYSPSRSVTTRTPVGSSLATFSTPTFSNPTPGGSLAVPGPVAGAGLPAITIFFLIGRHLLRRRRPDAGHDARVSR